MKKVKSQSTTALKTLYCWNTNESSGNSLDSLTHVLSHQTIKFNFNGGCKIV